MHDLSFLHYPQTLTADSLRYYKGQIGASIARADHILSVSQATKRDLSAMLAVPADKISVQHHGVDDSFKPLPRETSAPIIDELALPREYILAVGTMEPRKNLAGLARAYRDLKQELPDAPKLVFAGRPGWRFPQLMAELRAVGVNDDMIIRHDIADEQLPALYNHALALVTPSFYEGFGLPALEAMACGTAPIVSDVASLPEIVGDVGLLIDPHDTGTITEALKTALTDTGWRQAQAAAGLKRAAKFRWLDTARGIFDRYEALLNSLR